MKSKYLLAIWAALTLALMAVMVALDLWYMEIGKVDSKYYGGRSCFWPERPEILTPLRVAWTAVGLISVASLVGLSIYALHLGRPLFVLLVLLMWGVHLYYGIDLLHAYLGVGRYLPGQPCITRR